MSSFGHMEPVAFLAVWHLQGRCLETRWLRTFEMTSADRRRSVGLASDKRSHVVTTENHLDQRAWTNAPQSCLVTRRGAALKWTYASENDITFSENNVEPLQATESHMTFSKQQTLSGHSEPLPTIPSHSKTRKSHKKPLRATEKSTEKSCSSFHSMFADDRVAQFHFRGYSALALCGWVRRGPDFSNLESTCGSCDCSVVVSFCILP